MSRVVQTPSQNYTPSLIRHDLVIVHRTEGGYAGSVAWLCDPRANAPSPDTYGQIAFGFDGSGYQWGNFPV